MGQPDTYFLKKNNSTWAKKEKPESNPLSRLNFQLTGSRRVEEPINMSKQSDKCILDVGHTRTQVQNKWL